MVGSGGGAFTAPTTAAATAAAVVTTVQRMMNRRGWLGLWWASALAMGLAVGVVALILVALVVLVLVLSLLSPVLSRRSMTQVHSGAPRQLHFHIPVVEPPSRDFFCLEPNAKLTERHMRTYMLTK
jgi:predicted PurR-regulated permease PerM